MNEHQHKWRTRYVTIDGVDCASGMECECGVWLHQDQVEDIVNHFMGRLSEEIEIIDVIAEKIDEIERKWKDE